MDWRDYVVRVQDQPGIMPLIGCILASKHNSKILICFDYLVMRCDVHVTLHAINRAVLDFSIKKSAFCDDNGRWVFNVLGLAVAGRTDGQTALLTSLVHGGSFSIGRKSGIFKLAIWRACDRFWYWWGESNEQHSCNDYAAHCNYYLMAAVNEAMNYIRCKENVKFSWSNFMCIQSTVLQARWGPSFDEQISQRCSCFQQFWWKFGRQYFTYNVEILLK